MQTLPPAKSRLFKLATIATLIALLVVLLDTPVVEQSDPPATVLYDPAAPGNRLVELIDQSGSETWNPDEQRQFVELHLQMNDPVPLLAFLEAGNPAATSDIEFLKAHAQQLLAQQQRAEAIATLNRVIAIAPDDTEAQYRLGILLLVDDPAQANNALARAARDSRYTDTANRLRESIEDGLVDIYELSQLLLDSDEWFQAEQLLTLTIEQNPDDFVSYAYRGYAREQQGKSGLYDFEMALGLAPESPLPYYFLGLRWRTMPSERDAARAVLNIAFNLDPTNAAIAIEIAATLQLDGDAVQAVEWYNLAVALEPNNIEWHQQRAAFIAESEYALDSTGLLTIIESNQQFPQDAHILASLGHASHLIGETGGARTFLEQSLEIAPDVARTHYFYGLALESLNDLSGAITAFSEAIALDRELNGYGARAQRQLDRLRVTS